MSYKQYHNIPYNSKIEEAIIGSFSWGQLLWIAPAAVMSLLLVKLPPLPFENPVFSRIYVAIPLGIAFLFISFKHPKTNLSLSKYLALMIKFKFKRKKYMYQRENLTRYYRQMAKGVQIDGETKEEK